MDRGRSKIAVVEVPARKPGYVYYLCTEHFRVWYKKQQRAKRREAEQRRLAGRAGERAARRSGPAAPPMLIKEKINVGGRH